MYYDSGDAALFLLIYAVAAIIVCCIFGVVTKKINESKGYYGGFAWGFWLGIIGIIIVSCKPAARSGYSTPQNIPTGYSDESGNPLAYSNGGWKCEFCDRANPGHKMLCDCGRSKNESNQKKAKLRAEGTKQGKTVQEIQLEGAKRMYEDGIITEEEYEAKKKAIQKEMKPKEEKSSKSVTERQLENVKKMLDDGLITQEEYEVKRRIILGI